MISYSHIDMSEGFEILTPEIDYCAFMVAVLLNRISTTNYEDHLTFFPSELTTILNNLNVSASDKLDFRVDEVALHQGLDLDSL